MTRYLPRTAPALLLLVAALFLSAAGGAVAGGKITSAQIKNGTITGKDVKDGSLGTKELSAEAKAALDELDVVVAASPPQPVPSAAISTISVECPTDTVVIGGDVVFEDPANGVLQGAGPMNGNTVGWQADVQNTGGATQLVVVRAHCANLG